MTLTLVHHYTTYVVYCPSLISYTSDMVFIRDIPRRKGISQSGSPLSQLWEIYSPHGYSIIYCRCTHVFYKYANFVTYICIWFHTETITKDNDEKSAMNLAKWTRKIQLSYKFLSYYLGYAICTYINPYDMLRINNFSILNISRIGIIALVILTHGW
jgi:hypothetical protein